MSNPAALPAHEELNEGRAARLSNARNRGVEGIPMGRHLPFFSSLLFDTGERMLRYKSSTPNDKGKEGLGDSVDEQMEYIVYAPKRGVPEENRKGRTTRAPQPAKHTLFFFSTR